MDEYIIGKLETLIRKYREESISVSDQMLLYDFVQTIGKAYDTERMKKNDGIVEEMLKNNTGEAKHYRIAKMKPMDIIYEGSRPIYEGKLLYV